MVANARDDFPEPERPVMTTSLSRGMSRSIFLRLCSRAPRILRYEGIGVTHLVYIFGKLVIYPKNLLWQAAESTMLGELLPDGFIKMESAAVAINEKEAKQ